MAKFLIILLWLAGFIWGGVGVVERLFIGKKLLNLGSYVSWGLWVSLYIYLIGLSSGSYIFACLVSVFKLKSFSRLKQVSLLVSLVTLLGGLLAIVLDLGHWERFWYVFIHPAPSSMMSWMVWIYSLYFLIILAQMYYVLSGSLKASSLIFLFSFPLAVTIPVCGGSLFGVIGARPYWHSAIFPVIFLFEALLSGISLITVLAAVFGLMKEEKEAFILLSRIVLGLLLVNISLEIAVMAVPLWGQIAYHIDAVKLVLFGPFWWVFWLAHVGLCCVLPLFLLSSNASLNRITWACGLIVATFMSVRLNIVIPALAIPELKGLESAFIEKRLAFSYVPSPHEWQVSVFVVCLCAGLFYLGMRFFRFLGLAPRKES